ncbi:glycoside hydrolase family 2 TIM barrel-domain containing protein [Actinomadura sp. 7K507]|uniref:glycoside hydrolase family 2 TIM barrel-domain containing protein n=1 Tax=Actinomadura sp. 7K507 TaxID=2530365 RepID=UPI00105317D1|nr:glycoside hydrolase family 2 TIM barrel-domain containing protein [Actinomadura sp. 7K507]TDC93801.1 glycoside hydrolase family 2 [Actinomadura sp. 7K507]
MTSFPRSRARRHDDRPVHRLLVVLLAATALIAPALPAPAAASAPPPDVYTYLDDPEMVGEGQETPHAVLRPYEDAGQARQGKGSRWSRSLDGDWRFAIADRPDEVPGGFHEPGYDTSRWREVKVPHTWQSDRLDHPMFRNIPTEVWPDDPPKTPRDINPTGAYVKRLDVPDDWDGRRTFLRFEGVVSSYFVWVNGKYAGYDQGGYTPAEFDITDFVHAGENKVAVQVHRWSSASYMEDVDQWRYSGIFRSVWAYSTPKTYLRDATITTDLDDAYRDATLNVGLVVGSKDGPQGEHTVRATLVDPDGRNVQRISGKTNVEDGGASLRLTAPVRNPEKWTDETPNLYTLVLELADSRGRVVHTTAETLGFREIEVKDRQLLVNGRRILIKGVNRAETDPDTGRHQTRGRMESDVALMKRLNINAVRTAHYPSDPYLYDLADRRGLWIDDEVDIETHNWEDCGKTGDQDCLADRPEWQKAFLDRFKAMMARDKNHPSVLMWDTGNEAGLGAAHYKMADYAGATDPTRPLYHQSNHPDGDAPFADIWGPRYPTPARLEAQAAATTKPIIMGEYAHAMGNSLGNFREFWEVIRRHPQTQGGFIWDWAEANLRHPRITTPDSSGNDIPAWQQGLPKVVDGHRGKALYFSGLDDYVEVYRDRRFDLTGTSVTLDAWVKPVRPWTGDFTIVGKGDHSYALKMSNETTLEFFVHSGTWRTVRAPVPANWYDTWHRVTGTYDGTALRLYVDGREAASVPFTGAIDRSSWDVNVARNSETMQDAYEGRMAHGTIDDVRIYGRALTSSELDGGKDPKKDAILALDFDDFDAKGTFLSNGPSLSGDDGLVGSDRYVQPETAQLSWVQSPFRVTRADGKVSVSSERSFATGSPQLRWRYTEGSRTLSSGKSRAKLPPGGTADVRIPPPPANPSNAERWLTVEVVEDGRVVGFGQFSAGGTEVPGIREPATGDVDAKENGKEIVVTGKGFRYVFDKSKGTMTSMRARGRELLRTGPELDVWRPPISNETYTWGRAEGEDWRRLGLDRLATTPTSVTVADGGRVTVGITARTAAPDRPEAWFDQTATYVVDGAGQIELTHQVVPQGQVRSLPYLARVGYTLKVPGRYEEFAWYGRGPVGNYNDRKDGTPMGVYSSTVDEQYVSYYRPQAHGNHDDVRWTLLTDGRSGLLAAGVDGTIEASVTPYDDLDRALYPFARVRNPGWNTLHIDHSVTGVGDTPNPVRPEYQTRPDRTYSYKTLLRPLTGKEANTLRPSK